MTKIVSFLLLVNFLLVYGQYRGTHKLHPEVDLTFEQRIRRHGYPVERYETITEDDYILPLYNIPHGLKKSNEESGNKSAVLIVHGMGGSPHNFVVLGPKYSVPYYFADRGFDVWLFSARGVNSTLKKNHRRLDWDKDRSYWMFSLNEIAVYDLPSAIDFILNHTGQTKLSLVGHSAAGNAFFSMFSEKPEYNEKVKIAISWASSPILKRSDYPMVMFFSEFAPFLKGFNRLLRTKEFFPMFRQFLWLVRELCADPEWQEMCILMSAMVGSHRSVLQNPKDIQVIASNLPRISTRQIFHFMDNYNNGTFRKYDLGPKTNMQRYGQETPPHYNLSAAIAPTAFFLGPWDSIIQIEDIYESVSQIPNTVMIYQVPFDKFTHLDFIFARQASYLVYEPTYKLIKLIDNGIVPPPIEIPLDVLENIKDRPCVLFYFIVVD